MGGELERQTLEGRHGSVLVQTVLQVREPDPFALVER
jgi:hypothetical protein